MTSAKKRLSLLVTTRVLLALQKNPLGMSVADVRLCGLSRYSTHQLRGVLERMFTKGLVCKHFDGGLVYWSVAKTES